MHQMREGGIFAPHLDFQQHPHTGLDNRAVLITFLGRDWHAQYGGELVLCEDDSSKADVRILPVFGRTVLFLQTPASVHGVAPICAPPDRPRRSLAAYYYSNGGLTDRRLRSTTTIFVHRNQMRLADEGKWLLKRLAPPILLDAARLLRRKRQSD
jgi:Rps23 Pro-64 3,4-dihydroxylase Tpa1-like proline 4-hydroxylase